MNYSKLIPGCQQHQPDIEGYCGPASVLTCLGGMGFDISKKLQSDLYDMARGKPGTLDFDTWHSAPDLLVKIMNKRWPGVTPVQYTLAVSDDPGPLVMAMAAGIELYNAPSIALVQGGGHWISVVGYTATQKITKAVGDASQILDLESINCGQPLNHQLEAPDQRPTDRFFHHPGDLCGPTSGREKLTLTPLGDWEETPDWMSAAFEDGPWKNHRVAIVPKGVGGHLQDKFPTDSSGDKTKHPRGGGADAAVPLPQSVIAPEVAQRAVQAAVRQGELHLRPQWGEHLGKGNKRATPRSAEPILVHHASKADGAYYIVPLVGSKVAARVQAQTGGMLDFGLFDEPFRLAGYSKAKATTAIKQAAAAPKSGIKSLSLEAMHPEFVWQHGKLSASPYFPLHGFKHRGKWWGLNAHGRMLKLTSA